MKKSNKLLLNGEEIKLDIGSISYEDLLGSERPLEWGIIVERGVVTRTGEYSSYEKYSNGTFYAYGRLTKTTSGSGYISFGSPVPITDKANASIVASPADFNNRTRTFNAFGTAGNSTLLECYVYVGNAVVANTEVSFTWQLKGRWK